jgi:hypothetical protein
MISDKASIEDVASLIESRARATNLDAEVRALNDRIDEMHRELLR